MDELLLVGYRVLPPWDRLLTLSTCLVDAVPDDDTWFPTADAAAPHVRPGTRVLAMGIPATESAHFPRTHPWPEALTVLGYELIAPTEGGFHSWRCFQADPAGPLNANGLIDDEAAARRLAGRSDSTLPPITWLPAAIAV